MMKAWYVTEENDGYYVNYVNSDTADVLYAGRRDTSDEAWRLAELSATRGSRDAIYTVLPDELASIVEDVGARACWLVK